MKILGYLPLSPSADGSVHIPYVINPANPWVPEATAVKAIRAAFQTWQDADPAIRFDYGGTTAAPAEPFRTAGVSPLPYVDDNIVGWAPVAVNAADTMTVNGNDGQLKQIITQLDPTVPMFTYDCAQADGSCANQAAHCPGKWYPLAGDGIPDLPCVRGPVDLQAIMTHEVGHWLGLGDLEDPRDIYLTESAGTASGSGFDVSLYRRTLGLGDILGARAQYPCGCALPHIYEP